MGCCEGSEKNLLKRNTVSQPQALKDFLNATDNSEEEWSVNPESIVIDYHNADWKSLYSKIGVQKKLVSKEITLPMIPIINPKSLGGLSLVLLIEESKTDPEKISSVCLENPDLMLANFSKTAELRSLTMSLLFDLFEIENEDLKNELVQKRFLGILIGLFRSENYRIRTMSSHLASKIYAGNLQRQLAYLELGGEHALVQLIKREEDDDEGLYDLLDDLLDLVYDKDGYVVQENLERIKKTKLIEILSGIDFKEKNADLMEKYDEIIQLRPSD